MAGTRHSPERNSLTRLNLLDSRPWVTRFFERSNFALAQGELPRASNDMTRAVSTTQLPTSGSRLRSRETTVSSPSGRLKSWFFA